MPKITLNFSSKKEETKFINKAKEIYEDWDDHHLEYDSEANIELQKKQANQNFKEFLYIIGWITMIALIIWFFVAQFRKQPEPIIKTNEIYITGNIYEVTMDTKKLPAIWSLVYYYDNTMTIQSWAKLEQIRIDSDWVTRYRICLQEPAMAQCMEEYEDNRYPSGQHKDERCRERSNAPYSNCFDTVLIGNTTQWLKDNMCM